MCLVRRESEQETRLDEEWGIPLDRLFSFRRDTFENRVNLTQMGLPCARSSLDILGDCLWAFACHHFGLDYGCLVMSVRIEPRTPYFHQDGGYSSLQLRPCQDKQWGRF